MAKITTNPGPGNYSIPSTVSNLPKYSHWYFTEYYFNSDKKYKEFIKIMWIIIKE